MLASWFIRLHSRVNQMATHSLTTSYTRAILSYPTLYMYTSCLTAPADD